MNPPPIFPDPIAAEAAVWALKHDRGLTAVEQDAFSQWLADNPANRSAYAEARWGWSELDRLVGLQTSVCAEPDPDLLAPRRRWRPAPAVIRLVLPLLAVAAVVILGFFLLKSRHVVPDRPMGGSRSLALIEQRVLPDGSTVELNRGAAITLHFTAAERRVRLEHGEAHFKVAQDAARAFIVETAGVAVRAVGTVFDVRLESTAVEVLVTEGKVRVDDVVHGRSLLGSMRDGEPPVLVAGQIARVALAPTAVSKVTTLTPTQMEARLAWQPRMLDFTNTPMPEIVAEFNRHNSVQLALADPALARLRLSAIFRSDNVEAFVRLMESDFGLRAEWRGESEIPLLRRTR